jgi:hypothetical protein
MDDVKSTGDGHCRIANWHMGESEMLYTMWNRSDRQINYTEDNEASRALSKRDYHVILPVWSWNGQNLDRKAQARAFLVVWHLQRLKGKWY